MLAWHTPIKGNATSMTVETKKEMYKLANVSVAVTKGKIHQQFHPKMSSNTEILTVNCKKCASSI